ncbi:MAG TPA: NADH-quinone oxidoreductase subunit J [Chloroflexota bacterium]|nr:NADH-quinone oxidoreductase subunit J [Chloroflexota bacterium]
MSVVADIVFWIAAITAIAGGVGVIAARSPIYSALSLIATLAQLAVLYILLNAQFIAAAQILIYAGAVMVLFLFVITLLGIEGYPFLGAQLPFQRPAAVILSALLLAGVIFFVAESPHWLTGVHGNFTQQLNTDNVRAFGVQLFTTFFFPFELTAPLLIVAMIGAVALGKRRAGGTEI